MNPAEERRRFTPADIEAMRKQGMSYTDIARLEGVSRQAITERHQKLMTRQLSRRELTNRFWPWRVPSELQGCPPHQRARDHLAWRAGLELSTERRTRLFNWYQGLDVRGEVLEFDPAVPPIPGVASCGGWRYVERTAADEDLVIRVNEHTKLTEESRPMWRIPEVLPRDIETPLLLDCGLLGHSGDCAKCIRSKSRSTGCS